MCIVVSFSHSFPYIFLLPALLFLSDLSDSASRQAGGVTVDDVIKLMLDHLESDMSEGDIEHAFAALERQLCPDG